MSDMKIQGEVSLDTSNAEQAFGRVEHSATKMAGAVAQSGDKAGKSIEAIGNGGAAASAKVDRDTRNMVGSVQRATAAFQAGEKSGAKFYEALAAQRGINPEVLRPYLAQLDAAKAKAEATANANAGLTGSFGSLSGAAAAASRTILALGGPASLAGLGYMVKTIARNIDALNDLKDATGASIENISALEDIAVRTGTSFDSVGTSLIKFNKLLTEAKPGSGPEAVLKAIGVSAKELQALDPAEALQKTAIALQKFADDGNKARVVQELFGKSVKEAAPFLKDLAEAGELNATVTTAQAEAAEKFNKQLFASQANLANFGRQVTSEILPTLIAFNEAMSSGGKQSNALAAALGGGLKTTLETVTVLGLETAFVFKGVGREIGGIAAQIAALGRMDFNGFSAISDAMRADAQLARRESDAAIGRIMGTDLQGVESGDAMSRRLATGPRGSIGVIPDPVKASRETDPTKTPEYKVALGIADERQKLRLKESEEIRKFFLDQEEAATKAAKALIDLAQRTADAGTIARAQQIEALSKSNAEMRLEIELIGKTAAEVEALKLARMDEAIAAEGRLLVRKLEKEGYEGEYDALVLLIDKMREQRGLAATGGAARIAADAAKQAADEWKRTADSINQSLTDALLRGFESGKGFAENFRDTLKNMFSTLVLRPVIQGVLAPVSGMMSGAVSGMAGGDGAGMLSTAGSVSSLAGIGSSMATAYTAGSTSVGVMAGSVAGGGGMMGGAAAALGAVPVAGWIALAAMAIMAMSNGGETRHGGQYIGANLIDKPSGGEIGGDGVRTALGGTMSSIDDLLRSLGSTRTLGSLASGFESSEKGKGFAYAGGTLSDGTVFGQGVGGGGHLNRRGNLSQEQASAAFAEELKQVTLQALQASDVPGKLGEYLKSLGDIDALSGGALDAALLKIQTALTQKAQLEEQLFGLTHSEAEILAKQRDAERKATDESNRALLEQVYAQQDLKKATEAALAQKVQLGDELFSLTHTDLEILNKQREAERAAIDASNRALLEQVYAQQDLKKATEAATNAALFARENALNAVAMAGQGVRDSVDAERTRIERQYTSAVERTREQIDLVGASVSKLESLTSSLDGALSRLRTSGPGALSEREARAQIETATAIARASGVMPQADALQDALSILGQSEAAKFRTQADQIRAADANAQAIAELNALAGDSLSVEERLLDGLNDQAKILEEQKASQLKELDNIIKQVDLQTRIASGIDTMVLSLADAVSRFGTVAQAAKAVTGGGGISDADIAAFVQPRLGISEEVNRQIYDAAAANKDKGVSLSKIDTAGGLAPGTAAAWAIANGLQVFGSGAAFTNGVATRPTAFNMGMMGEQGSEAILPLANINGRLGVRSAGGDNERLASAVKAMADQISSLKRELEKVTGHTKRTKEVLEAAANGSAALTTTVEA